MVERTAKSPLAHVACRRCLVAATSMVMKLRLSSEVRIDAPSKRSPTSGSS
jgi:hypothetical protein